MVFTLDESNFNFLDKPFKENMEVFAYIVYINDVYKMIVNMGRTDSYDLVTAQDDKEKDRLSLNGKDITSLKDNVGHHFMKGRNVLRNKKKQEHHG